MRYLRILSLHMQQIFQERARSFIWFISALLQPLILIGLWTAAFKTQGSSSSWNLITAREYYLILIIVATLMPWTEETVSKEDILARKLTQYLLKPFSYYWYKFYEEIPYRILQCFYAIIISIFLMIILGLSVVKNINLLSLTIIILGFFVAFNYKVIIGLLAFWFTEVVGILNLTATILLTFAGYIMPIPLLPKYLLPFVWFTPFPYMIYYPVISLQGKLTQYELLRVISLQLIWIFILYVLYRFMWKKGVQLFTSFGQ